MGYSCQAPKPFTTFHEISEAEFDGLVPKKEEEAEARPGSSAKKKFTEKDLEKAKKRARDRDDGLGTLDVG